jgi:hypothetical protein
VALNKYWGHCDLDRYLHKMSVPMVQEAVMISGMPQEVLDRIWEEDRGKSPSFKWHKTETKQV